MTDRVVCPPPPGTRACATLLVHTLMPGDTLYRVFRGEDPACFTRTTGANRFDPLPAPFETMRVLYAGSSAEVAMSETVLRWHDRVERGSLVILSRSQFAGRKLAALTVDRPLALLDFTGFGVKPLRELVSGGLPEGIFLGDRSSYPITQRWAAWFLSQHREIGGFRWMSRQHNRSECYVFFDDRCKAVRFVPVNAEDAVEPGTAAFAVLERCVAALGWEIEL